MGLGNLPRSHREEIHKLRLIPVCLKLEPMFLYMKPDGVSGMHFLVLPSANPQVAELLKNRHQIQPLIPMGITPPGFEGSSCRDARRR